jgi:predicted dinucleotide-binding enzyme
MTSYAIIGAGAIGAALAERFHAAGVPAVIANSRGPATLNSIAGRFKGSVKAVDASEALLADVVILGVPYDAIPSVVGGRTSWGGRIIVDASNALDLPAFTPRDLGGRISTDIVSELVPDAKVVKAFNSLMATLLVAEPHTVGGRRVLFLSGNHPEANGEVAELISALGFAPIDLGTLARGASLQQYGGPLAAISLLKE